MSLNQQLVNGGDGQNVHFVRVNSKGKSISSDDLISNSHTLVPSPSDKMIISNTNSAHQMQPFNGLPYQDHNYGAQLPPGGIESAAADNASRRLSATGGDQRYPYGSSQANIRTPNYAVPFRNRTGSPNNHPLSSGIPNNYLSLNNGVTHGDSVMAPHALLSRISSMETPSDTLTPAGLNILMNSSGETNIPIPPLKKEYVPSARKRGQRGSGKHNKVPPKLSKPTAGGAPRRGGKKSSMVPSDDALMQQQRAPASSDTDTTTDTDTETGEDWVARCVCGMTHDDGFMIMCDGCGVWQHVECMGMSKSNVPKGAYFCELCQPRTVDKERAIELQRRKLQGDDSSETDDDESDDDDGAVASRPSTSRRGGRGRRGGGAHPRPLQPKTGRASRGGYTKRGAPRKTGRGGASSSAAKHRSDAEADSETERRGEGRRRRAEKAAAASLSEEASSLAAKMRRGKTSGGKHGPPTDDDETDATQSECSAEVKSLILAHKLNGHRTLNTKWKPELDAVEADFCRLRSAGEGKYAVEASQPVAAGQTIAEFIGLFLTRKEYTDDIDTDFFSREPSPQQHVLFYCRHPFDLCLDATRYAGSLARNVRRSCHPNAEVRHWFDDGGDGAPRLFLYATEAIDAGEEVTIPFDFTYQNCEYEVTCPCDRKTCQVTAYFRRRSVDHKSSGATRGGRRASAGSSPGRRRRVSSNEVKSERTGIGELEDSGGGGGRRARAPSHAALSAQTEAAASSASSSPAKRRGRRPSAAGKERHESQASDDGSVSSETRRQLSREERSVEAAIKAIEQMEKRQAVKQRRDSSASRGGGSTAAADGDSAQVVPGAKPTRSAKYRMTLTRIDNGPAKRIDQSTASKNALAPAPLQPDPSLADHKGVGQAPDESPNRATTTTMGLLRTPALRSGEEANAAMPPPRGIPQSPLKPTRPPSLLPPCLEVAEEVVVRSPPRQHSMIAALADVASSQLQSDVEMLTTAETMIALLTTPPTMSKPSPQPPLLEDERRSLSEASPPSEQAPSLHRPSLSPSAPHADTDTTTPPTLTDCADGVLSRVFGDSTNNSIPPEIPLHVEVKAASAAGEDAAASRERCASGDSGVASNHGTPPALASPSSLADSPIRMPACPLRTPISPSGVTPRKTQQTSPPPLASLRRDDSEGGTSSLEDESSMLDDGGGAKGAAVDVSDSETRSIGSAAGNDADSGKGKSEASGELQISPPKLDDEEMKAAREDAAADADDERDKGKDDDDAPDSHPAPSQRRNRSRGGRRRGRGRRTVAQRVAAANNDTHSVDSSSNGGDAAPGSDGAIAPAGEFKCPKTKRQQLAEWLATSTTGDKPLTLANSDGEEGGEEIVIAKPKSRAHQQNAFRDLKRTPGANASTHQHQEATPAVQPSPVATPGKTPTSSSVCHGKKRWLQQAMSSVACSLAAAPPASSSTPIIEPGSGANSERSSPAPPDTLVSAIAPLKKRRLARESVDETPPVLSAPATPQEPPLVGADTGPPLLLAPPLPGSDAVEPQPPSLEAVDDKLQDASSFPLKNDGKYVKELSSLDNLTPLDCVAPVNSDTQPPPPSADVCMPPQEPQLPSPARSKTMTTYVPMPSPADQASGSAPVFSAYGGASILSGNASQSVSFFPLLQASNAVHIYPLAATSHLPIVSAAPLPLLSAAGAAPVTLTSSASPSSANPSSAIASSAIVSDYRTALSNGYVLDPQRLLAAGAATPLLLDASAALTHSLADVGYPSHVAGGGATSPIYVGVPPPGSTHSPLATEDHQSSPDQLQYQLPSPTESATKKKVSLQDYLKRRKPSVASEMAAAATTAATNVSVNSDDDGGGGAGSVSASPPPPPPADPPPPSRAAAVASLPFGFAPAPVGKSPVPLPVPPPPPIGRSPSKSPRPSGRPDLKPLDVNGTAPRSDDRSKTTPSAPDRHRYHPYERTDRPSHRQHGEKARPPPREYIPTKIDRSSDSRGSVRRNLSMDVPQPPRAAAALHHSLSQEAPTGDASASTQQKIKDLIGQMSAQLTKANRIMQEKLASATEKSRPKLHDGVNGGGGGGGGDAVAKVNGVGDVNRERDRRRRPHDSREDDRRRRRSAEKPPDGVKDAPPFKVVQDPKATLAALSKLVASENLTKTGNGPSSGTAPKRPFKFGQVSK